MFCRIFLILIVFIVFTYTIHECYHCSHILWHTSDLHFRNWSSFCLQLSNEITMLQVINIVVIIMETKFVSYTSQSEHTHITVLFLLTRTFHYQFYSEIHLHTNDECRFSRNFSSRNISFPLNWRIVGKGYTKFRIGWRQWWL